MLDPVGAKWIFSSDRRTCFHYQSGLFFCSLEKMYSCNFVPNFSPINVIHRGLGNAMSFVLYEQTQIRCQDRNTHSHFLRLSKKLFVVAFLALITDLVLLDLTLSSPSLWSNFTVHLKTYTKTDNRAHSYLISGLWEESSTRNCFTVHWITVLRHFNVYLWYHPVSLMCNHQTTDPVELAVNWKVFSPNFILAQ